MALVLKPHNSVSVCVSDTPRVSPSLLKSRPRKCVPWAQVGLSQKTHLQGVNYATLNQEGAASAFTQADALWRECLTRERQHVWVA